MAVYAAIDFEYMPNGSIDKPLLVALYDENWDFFSYAKWKGKEK